MLYKKIQVLLTWIYVINIYCVVDNNEIESEGAKAIGSILLQKDTNLKELDLSNLYLLR
jgi:hypothetical protein